jgi:hypothetical protein
MDLIGLPASGRNLPRGATSPRRLVSKKPTRIMFAIRRIPKSPHHKRSFRDLDDSMYILDFIPPSSAWIMLQLSSDAALGKIPDAG